MCGTNGFGYDPLFFLPEFGLTMAEIPAEKKNEISHRANAIKQLEKDLAEVVEKVTKSEKISNSITGRKQNEIISS